MPNITSAGRAVLIISTLCIFTGSAAPLRAGSERPDSTTLLDKFLEGPMAEVDEIIFAARQPGAGGHWYENFGYYAQDESNKVYRAMGQLCSLNIRTGRLRVLLDDKEGSVRDPQVRYDGRMILFSYRKADAG